MLVNGFHCHVLLTHLGLVHLQTRKAASTREDFVEIWRFATTVIRSTSQGDMATQEQRLSRGVGKYAHSKQAGQQGRATGQGNRAEQTEQAGQAEAGQGKQRQGSSKQGRASRGSVVASRAVQAGTALNMINFETI